MSTQANEGEMIVYLQTNGAKYDRRFKQWSHVSFYGLFPTFKMYQMLKKVVDKAK